MTGGWSSYTDGGSKNSRKLHFFENNHGKSICNQNEISDRKLKHKFVDPDDFNPNKVCKKCIVKHKFLMVTKWGLQ